MIVLYFSLKNGELLLSKAPIAQDKDICPENSNALPACERPENKGTKEFDFYEIPENPTGWFR